MPYLCVQRLGFLSIVNATYDITVCGFFGNETSELLGEPSYFGTLSNKHKQAGVRRNTQWDGFMHMNVKLCLRLVLTAITWLVSL